MRLCIEGNWSIPFMTDDKFWWTTAGPQVLVDYCWTPSSGGLLLDPKFWWTTVGPQVLVDYCWTPSSGGLLLDHKFWWTTVGPQVLVDYCCTAVNCKVSLLSEMEIRPATGWSQYVDATCPASPTCMCLKPCIVSKTFISSQSFMIPLLLLCGWG